MKSKSKKVKVVKQLTRSQIRKMIREELKKMLPEKKEINNCSPYDLSNPKHPAHKKERIHYCRGPADNAFVWG